MYCTKLSRRRAFAAALSLACLAAPLAAADPADPEVVKALAFAPKQPGIEYEQVDAAGLPQCTKRSEPRNASAGLAIYGPANQPLRWFADTNGDRQPDVWAYYQNGVEVYRDLDTDYDGRVDESRWLGTAGTRWGVDENEDGVLDRWKSISPEEVTMEVVAAIRDADARRFARVLLTPEQIDALGLSEAKAEDLRDRVAAATAQFDAFVKSQKVIAPQTRWINFGADKPGVVPAGTDGSTKDVVAYENVAAIIETQKKSDQVLIGSLIQSPDSGWRAIDLPRATADGTVLTSTAFFFNDGSSQMPPEAIAEGGLTEEVQDLLEELSEVETALDTAKDDAEVARLNERRADIMLSLYEQSQNPDDKTLWAKQLADTVASAVQAGRYPGGVQRLEQFASQLPEGDDLRGYVEYRILSSWYAQQISDTEPAEFATVQTDYLKRLEDFVDTYPEVGDAAEAMIQLGLNAELSGDLDTARKWYKQTADRFAGSENRAGKKAAGAILRLALAGREMNFKGKTIDGKDFAAESIRDKVMLVHFWASWCGPCHEDMEKFRALQAKYPNQIAIVGINLDSDRETAAQFLKQHGNKYPWVHLYEPGGFDGNLPVALGVFSLPVTILTGKDHKVLESATHLSPDLEAKIETAVKAK